MRNWLCAVVGEGRALGLASGWLSYLLVFAFFTLLGPASPAITGSRTQQAVSSTAGWIELSLPGFDLSHWHAVHDMRPTVLQILEFDVSKIVHPGDNNVLAVKITPEQSIPSTPTRDGTISGSTVELGDTGRDWLNWKYSAASDRQTGFGFSFPPDRNSQISKRLYLSSSRSVTIRNPYVASELPLPETNPASLIGYCDISNDSSKPVSESCKKKSPGQANRQFGFSSQCLSSAMRRNRFPFRLMRFPS